MADHELDDPDALSHDKMCADSAELIKYARDTAVGRVNIVQTMTNCCIGKWSMGRTEKDC